MRKLILVLFGFCYFLGSYYGPAEGNDLETGFEGIEWGGDTMDLRMFALIMRALFIIIYAITDGGDAKVASLEEDLTSFLAGGEGGCSDDVGD